MIYDLYDRNYMCRPATFLATRSTFRCQKATLSKCHFEGRLRRQKKQQEAEGSPIPVFLAPTNLKPFIPTELDSGPLAPIIYQDKGRTVYGFEATLLPAVCDIWLRAHEANALQKQQLDKAQNAEILMRGLAHVGIIALIDEATGYQAERTRDALQELLAIYLSEKN